MNILDVIKRAVTVLGTGLTWVLGTWDTAIMVLVCFMVLDYTTGLMRAYINKEVSSDVGLKGIARKTVIFIVLIVAVLLDRLMNTGTWVFRTLSATFSLKSCNPVIYVSSLILGRISYFSTFNCCSVFSNLTVCNCFTYSFPY